MEKIVRAEIFYLSFFRVYCFHCLMMTFGGLM